MLYKENALLHQFYLEGQLRVVFSMQNIAQLLTMLLKYPPTDAHINITMKLMNKMYILWNSIMCQQISLSDCKNEKSLSKDRAQSRNDAETSEAYPKACVPVHSFIPILITTLQNGMIAKNYYHIVITNGLLFQTTSKMSTRPEIFRFNQICCVVELVQSKSKYNFLMVLCEDCQSQTLFAVHVLEILTTLIDQSQFNYVQKVKQLQTTHFFHTKNCDVGNCFTIIQLCTEALWQL